MHGRANMSFMSRALTDGRKIVPARRRTKAEHKPVKTLCAGDVRMVSCLAVLIGGEFKVLVGRVI